MRSQVRPWFNLLYRSGASATNSTGSNALALGIRSSGMRNPGLDAAMGRCLTGPALGEEKP
jgi:hypothetical protein